MIFGGMITFVLSSKVITIRASSCLHYSIKYLLPLCCQSHWQFESHGILQSSPKDGLPNRTSFFLIWGNDFRSRIEYDTSTESPVPLFALQWAIILSPISIFTPKILIYSSNPIILLSFWVTSSAQSFAAASSPAPSDLCISIFLQHVVFSVCHYVFHQKNST